ncbi:MAG: cytochrome c [Bacteroidota bacterium]
MLKKVNRRLENWKIGRFRTIFPSIFPSFHPSIIFAAFGMIALVSSCSNDPQKPGLEYMPDMYRSPSLETYQATGLFSDSSSARQPVAGTIPRGYNTYFPYPNTPDGYEAAGKELKNPFEAHDKNIKEGDRLYHIYCQHCHGAKGGGDGTLRIKGEKFPVNFSYTDSAYINLAEGKMFFTITYGKNLMGSHASQLDPDQRWKIISYIKSLQATALAEKSKKPADAKMDSTATAKK